jgi:hypothetical protein
MHAPPNFDNTFFNIAQAYASDLVKDGTLAFAFKISGHKHTFEAQNSPERDGWFVAVEKAIVEAKETKETVESGEAYKETKEKLGKSANSRHLLSTSVALRRVERREARRRSGRPH